MRNGLISNLLNPIIQLVGQSDKSLFSAPGPDLQDFNAIESRKRQSAIRTASLLINRLEKEDCISAVTALYGMHPETRVFVAETMLWINRQHRSIVTSLPIFHCSFVMQGGKRTDLACVEISTTGADGCATSNTFSFKSMSHSIARLS